MNCQSVKYFANQSQFILSRTTKLIFKKLKQYDSQSDDIIFFFLRKDFLRRLNQLSTFLKKNDDKECFIIFFPFCLFQLSRSSFVCQSSNENENFEMNLTIPTVLTIYLILIQCLTDSSPMSTTTTRTTNGQNFSEKFENSESGKKRFRCTSPLGSSDGSIVLESEDGQISGLTTLQVRVHQCFFLHFFLHYLCTEKDAQSISFR